MRETSKTKKIWTDFERGFLKGDGIDIGCGPDPISPQAVPFDMADGDANVITRHVQRQFDFVFSSHCLEHMRDPRQALLEWWQLVKPGGFLFVVVPDEDLYEQGFWPSRFNDDHKWTFTISKSKSWSPVSVNVLDLVKTLPQGELMDVRLHDHNYDRGLMAQSRMSSGFFYGLKKPFKKLISSLLFHVGLLSKDQKIRMRPPVDQTAFEGVDVLAQIQFIVRKRT